MILNLLYLYLFYGIQLQLLLADDGGDDSLSNKIICEYRGSFSEIIPSTPDLDSSCIPQECDIILFVRFAVVPFNFVNVDYEAIKNLKKLNKPIFVDLFLSGGYDRWVSILSDNNGLDNVCELCKFIKETGVDGFLLRGITPWSVEEINPIIKHELPNYIKSLQSSCSPKIGVVISTSPIYIQNTTVYDFDALNPIVDFYVLTTAGMNKCKPDMYNDLDLLYDSPPDDCHMLSMTEVTCIVKDTSIDYSKVIYILNMSPSNSENKNFVSYNEVCTSINADQSCKWCIQSTKDYYEKAAYIKEEKCGILIHYIDLDDISNACECGPFIGLKNIVAGYTGGQEIPCAKFDIDL